MNLWLSVVLLFMMVTSASVGFTSSLYVSWGCMELNLLLFMLIMLFDKFQVLGKTGIAFFLIQSISGLMILIILINLASFKSSGWLLNFFSLVLLFKMGGFPFHQWVVKLGAQMSWGSLYLMLTIQKLIPLLFLKSAFSQEVLLLSGISWLLLGVLSYLFKHLKKIFILSSVFFLMALLALMKQGEWKWKTLLVLYSLMLSPLILLEGGEKESVMSSKGVQPSTSSLLWWLLILLSISGIPPFGGFLIKLEVFSLLVELNNFIGVLIFSISAMLFMYLYLTVMLSLVGISESGSQLKAPQQVKISVFWLSGVALFMIS